MAAEARTPAGGPDAGVQAPQDRVSPRRIVRAMKATEPIPDCRMNSVARLRRMSCPAFAEHQVRRSRRKSRCWLPTGVPDVQDDTDSNATRQQPGSRGKFR